MDGIVLLLLSLVSANEGETQDRFLEGCNSHCTSKFDENLSCWNKTAQFFGKTLVGVFLRYVTTQVHLLFHLINKINMWTITLSDPFEITYGRKVVCGANGIQFSDKISKSINWISVNGSYKLSFPVNILTATKEHYGKLPTSDKIAKISVDRMVKYMEDYYSDSILTTEIINKTITAFVSASFKTIKTVKQPALLPCPHGCERSSKFWLSWSFISLLLSGILTAIIIFKSLEKDRIDQNYAVVEETVETDRRKAN